MPHRSKNAGRSNHKFVERGPAGEKMCSECRRHRPLAEFNRDVTRFDGYGYICAGCRALRRKAPGPTIRERRAEVNNGRRWCSRCEDWTAVGKGGLCRAHAAEYARVRYATNPRARVARIQHSMSRKRRLAPIPVDAAVMILEEFDGRCAYCDAPATTWDHVVPVAKGGLTEPYNVVPACRSCNSRKRTKNVWDWLAETGRQPHDILIDRLTLYHASLFPAAGPDPFE